ncbi:probable insulin-like peptide 2 [Drosophila miranda]|uniref:Probable insulin-like peptide 2 n=1 Tax=Drosophila pseudoobscura pseudoobscura TaxID=46245 RepID=A0A6I8WDH6_DROPS|nr:probable insulin-like peptide 2 [Drosophila miranda]XP_026847822.1 probable insulin-like peptide 2 [Drosophila persimilis]XP_033241287.1 probable insulin-like peptide 2 [Drosophila pseudoobscura]
MSKIVSVSLVLVLLAVTLSCGVADSSMYMRDQSNHVLCSYKLNEMLSLVCKEFNSVLPHKRGMPAATELDPLDPIQYVEDKEGTASDVLPYPLFGGRFYGGEEALSSLAAVRRRTRQGIADRCCRKPCDISVLTEYCSIPNY